MLSAHSAVDKFELLLTTRYPFFKTSVENQYLKFGDAWRAEFGDMLVRMFGDDDDKFERALRGYVDFAIDGLRLQKKFEKDRRYVSKSYEQAKKEVYMNDDYMMSLYLPGILLSHYLWPHHYRQLLFFRKTFLAMIKDSREKKFCDVGIGTGFYSRVILCADSEIRGKGFDISPFSSQFTQWQVRAFGLEDRYEIELRNVVDQPPALQWPYLVSVEVLEHLEDPLSFLKALRRMLAPGGRGFITAAITAPNQDHIYLYETADEVIRQLKQADFDVLDYIDEKGYEPKANEPVPRLGAFIVQ